MKKYTNFFASYHPICQAIYFISIFFLIITINNPALRVGSCIMLILYAIFLQGIRKFFKSLLYIIPLLLFVSIINPIFVHDGETILFYFNDVPFTLESILYGLFSGVLIIALIYFFTGFNACIDAHRLNYLIGRALPSISLMLSMVIRYMPHLEKRLKEISAVQGTLGLSTKNGSNKIKVSNAGNILLSLISVSLEDGIETSDSMNARGYYLKGKTHFHTYRIKATDIYVIIITAIIDVLIIVPLFSGRLAFEIYPLFTSPINDNYTFIMFIIYTAFTALPMLVNILEELRWKFLRSRI